MKRSELKLMIREVVREEVSLALRKILKERKLAKVKKKPVNTKVKGIKPKATYSSKPVLNEIMNDTAQEVEWETLGGKPFTTSDMGQLLAKEYSMDGGKPNVAQMAAEEGINPSSLPDHVTKAITKDYSEVMKAIDQKKNGTG
jgi:hypothetical protein